ncbi:transcription factor EC-like [Mercenaria mercenaria]|uniref:transcription factor EC-like n=1 Tax=Mercenaria mercenaria TaxID=6596 RepID=UPI00234F9689|nr:transcription factor EC-like [Mercenaria mercenaria]
MSDFIWSYKNLKDDHKNSDYDSFKHLLYGSRNTPQSDRARFFSLNHGINNSGENWDNQYKARRRTDFRNKFSGSERAYQDIGSTYRRDSYCRKDDRKEYWDFDELERLSSCLIQFLGEARKDGKLRKKLEHPAQSNVIQQSKPRNAISVGDPPPHNVAKVQSSTDTIPASFSNVNTQTNADSPLSVGLWNTPFSTSELRNKLEHPAQSIAIQQSKPRNEMSIGDPPPHNVAEVQSSTDIRPASFSNGNTQTNADSPLSVGLCNTPFSISEVDSILNDLHDLDSQENMEDDLNYITPSLCHAAPVAPVVPNCMFPMHKGPAPTTLATAPRENSAKPWDKERKKKENHNMVERRRRIHINERIKELGSLLPNNGDTKLRHNKGSVLKATVDYIKQLQKEKERFDKIEEMVRQNYILYKKMLLRIQRLEAIMNILSLNKIFQDSLQEIASIAQTHKVNTMTISSQVKSGGPQSVPSGTNAHANTTSARNQSAAMFSAETENMDYDDVMSDCSDDSLYSSSSGSPNSLA